MFLVTFDKGNHCKTAYLPPSSPEKKKNQSSHKKHLLTLKLPSMTKTVFLLTISLQYQEEIDENKEKYELGDYLWV